MSHDDIPPEAPAHAAPAAMVDALRQCLKALTDIYDPSIGFVQCFEPGLDAIAAARAALAGQPQEPAWPCARIVVDEGGQVTSGTLYAPGLPAGAHDVWCSADATRPELERLRAQHDECPLWPREDGR